MIQSVKKELAPEQGFGEICESAAQTTITSLVDCNDDRFLAPENMTKEVQEACRESGQQVPEGIAEVAVVIYKSLAKCYAKTIAEIESMTGCRYDSIHVVGGGANAGYLNELTAKATGCRVYGAWRALEDLYEEGKIRSLGISNFYVDRMVEFVNFNRIKPMINQMEVHIFNQQKQLKEYADKYDVQLEA